MGMSYPTMRNLDGVYFRVKRDEGYTPVCWTDLTDEERERFGADRPASWWKSLADHLAERLRHVGDALDIEFVYEEDE